MIKIFRQKYKYNQTKPLYQSPQARTYNCMNTQTNNINLVIIQHLIPPQPPIQSQTILQPIQSPTQSQPFSVYPITSCVSDIHKISQPDAMYVLKCMAQCVLKKPLYYLVGPDGIACSDVEGLLPYQTPELVEIVGRMLGLDQKFMPKDYTAISKWGLEICQAIKKGQFSPEMFSSYGWRDPKKSSEIITDQQFTIFKGRRKEEGTFDEEYGLAFNRKIGLCRFKYINLVKDGYDDYYYEMFADVINYIINRKDDEYPFQKIHKYSKDSKGIRIFTELSNQGTLSEYIQNRNETGQPITQKNSIEILDTFIESMAIFTQEFKNQGLGTLHIKNMFVHNNRICIGEPVLITDRVEKKLIGLKRTMDYYAAQMKENLGNFQGFKHQSKEKMDIWAFGFILHRFFTKEIPVFDAKKPIINKSKLSPAMGYIIKKCLSEYAVSRPTWKQLNMKDIQRRSLIIEDVVKEEQIYREEIKLGTRKQRSDKPRSMEKKKRIIEELEEEINYQHKEKEEEEQEKLKEKSEEILEQKMPIPKQVTSKVRRVKLIIKTILIMALYIFVFFQPFIWSSIQIIQIRSNYASTTLHLVDNQNRRMSSVSIITSQSIFFMSNDISFDDVQNKYQCIDDNFDPIYNPGYSLLSYIQSPSFLALLLTGWLTMIIICAMKGVSMWRGGISHRPEKNQVRHWVSYVFYELSLAALLFAHFYIYEFFYFAGATPCLNIKNFQGLQPFFDSSLYLFLSNTTSYFQQVFSTLGILSLILLLSSCFHAWGPKQDQKHISSIPSILFRLVPYFLLFLICRLGVFMLYSPTAINDKTSLLPKILAGSFQGFIGIIPEFFIMICVLIEVLMQLLMRWCEKKTAESDKFARFFNIKKKKITMDNQRSRVESSIIDNSNMKLDGNNDY